MAVKPIYAVGLDAGSRQTRMVICALEGGRLRFLGAASVESQGWHKGPHRRPERRHGFHSEALCARRRPTAGVSVESVVVGVGGPTVRGANSRGVVELGHVREIEQRDVNRVVDRASRVQLQEDRMVLQVFPQDFVVDDHPGHRDPRKMMASRLEINVHLVTASVQEHTALVGAVNQAHLVVEETVFEGLAACYAAVLPEERRRGNRAWWISARNPPNWWCTTATRMQPGLQRARLRRPFHARPGAGALPSASRMPNW